MKTPMFYPERFHGRGKQSDFFEGWYFKMFDMQGQNVLAVVPGIYYSSKKTPEENHAFIFLNIDGKEQHYYRFPVESFVASRDKFFVTIDGVNEFSEDGIKLKLAPKEGDDAKLQVSGELQFHGIKKWPVSMLSPGVMGPVAFLPGVECYHGIVSMDHEVSGALDLNGHSLNFQGGRGYIEKDWGKHFPKSWVWIQTNLFRDSSVENGGPSLFFSAADVPYMGTSFPGFICGFVDEAGKLHRFTSYLLSKFENFVVDDSTKDIFIKLKNGTHELEIKTSYDVPLTKLYTPRDGKMQLLVNEGLTAHVNVSLSKRGGETVFQGRGECGGIEVEGDIAKLTKSLAKE